MASEQDPITDPRRLAALRRAGLLDSPPEQVFDRLAQAAAEIMGSPIGLVSLVDEDRQFFKSSTASSGPFRPEHETPLYFSLCRYAVGSREPLILRDARTHPEFREHPVVRAEVAAYAGFPILLEDGQAIGVVCVLDTQPRAWSEEQVSMLSHLAQDAARLIARRSREADARAWRVAARAGVTPEPTRPSQADGEATGLAVLPQYLEQLEAGSAAGGAEALANGAAMLSSFALLYLRQMDAYVRKLAAGQAPASTSSRELDELRASVVQAEAGLLRAVETFDREKDDPAPADRHAAPAGQDPATALRDRCAAFLEAEQRRSRASLLFRRSLLPLVELERAVTDAAEAEQAMRLALHNYQMQTG